MKPRFVKTLHLALIVAMLLTQFVLVGVASAQLPAGGTASQFDLTGFLQAASLDPTCVGSATCGGSLTVNGHVVTVPKNLVVIFPANQLTWAEVFAQAPAPYTGVATGMATTDVPTPLTTYEVHVTGNKVKDTYIAALIDVSQQGLNQGQGYINFIDYTLGEIRVGGVIKDPNCAQGGTPVTNPLCSGARVRLNDPTGKFGRAGSPDIRFTLDPDNPTMKSETGFPMCLPRTLTVPTAAADDAACPLRNRPADVTGAFAGAFVTPDPTPGAAPGTGVTAATADPTIMAPFEIGDYVTFNGTLVLDQGFPTVGPYVATLAYVSAHTITNNIGIYTWPGTDPAYVSVDVSLMGTGGITAPGVAEAAFRTRFEGMTTDPSRRIHLYALDVTPGSPNTTTGASRRDWGTIGVDLGAPTGAVKGRWRFRPPCATFGTVVTKPDKQCVMNQSGVFDPPSREVLAVLETPGGAEAKAVPGMANGLVSGSYHAPIAEYIFPEQVVGSPVPPANFDAIPFLAVGGYVTTAGTQVGQLTPWPGDTVPSTVLPTAPPPPPAAPGDVIIATIVYRLDKQRLQVTAASSVGSTLFIQVFDTKGKAINATRTPVQMVPVLGIPTLDIVGTAWPGKIVVTSSLPGGFESADLTKLGFPTNLTSAQIGKYNLQPDQPLAPVIAVTIRQN